MQDLWTRLRRLQPVSERQTRYDEFFHVGMSSLQIAQETPDKSHCLQSGHAFVLAIRGIPNRPEAWLGLSYLLYLLKDEACALFYVRQVLEQTPDLLEAQELHDLLDSSFRLSQLSFQVEAMKHQNHWEERPPEKLSDGELHDLLHQSQALLQIQHLLLTFELDQGRFLKLQALKQRQKSLEDMHRILRTCLKPFESHPSWGLIFKDLFTQFAQDMTSLHHLELLFEAMHQFQKEVHGVFTEMTRRTLRLRIHGQKELAENQQFMADLHDKLQQLAIKMSGWPAHLQLQAQNSSGWPHLLQQMRQFQEQLNRLSQPNHDNTNVL